MLMIVNDFYQIRSHIRPYEADTELVIDSNTVLAFAVSAERFKMITRRAAQERQRVGVVEHLQLSLSYCPERGKFRYRFTFKKLFSQLASK